MIRKTLAAASVALAVLAAGCSAGSTTAAPVAGAASASSAALPKSEPVSLDIPRIDAHSTLVPLGLNPDNSVQVPPVSKPLQAGWYENGPTPGEIGPAVVLGHVDGNKQKGIFYRLKEMKPGDDVDIARRDGTTAHFQVTKVDQVPKDAFPTDAVYGDTSDPELRLITCGGAFDRSEHSYVDNIIVYAHLVNGAR
ncbi:class F sortase [Amycolatopsis sp. AA4]|uniref:class F sortase n=1 Tax=Actinomycetes TaxID=1760 RepID=UPI0001B54F9A|nr:MULTISPECIES: class F sortase [Actinomycetes]ATY09578.1 class F sortase [Amycolatopsis sp. AA4]EFL04941.1 peptidase C60 [Streptomyces sp. AA4]